MLNLLLLNAQINLNGESQLMSLFELSHIMTTDRLYFHISFEFTECIIYSVFFLQNHDHHNILTLVILDREDYLFVIQRWECSFGHYLFVVNTI